MTVDHEEVKLRKLGIKILAILFFCLVPLVSIGIGMGIGIHVELFPLWKNYNMYISSVNEIIRTYYMGYSDTLLHNFACDSNPPYNEKLDMIKYIRNLEVVISAYPYSFCYYLYDNNRIDFGTFNYLKNGNLSFYLYLANIDPVVSDINMCMDELVPGSLAAQSIFLKDPIVNSKVQIWIWHQVLINYTSTHLGVIPPISPSFIPNFGPSTLICNHFIMLDISGGPKMTGVVINGTEYQAPLYKINSIASIIYKNKDSIYIRDMRDLNRSYANSSTEVSPILLLKPALTRKLRSIIYRGFPFLKNDQLKFSRSDIYHKNNGHYTITNGIINKSRPEVTNYPIEKEKITNPAVFNGFDYNSSYLNSNDTKRNISNIISEFLGRRTIYVPTSPLLSAIQVYTTGMKEVKRNAKIRIDSITSTIIILTSVMFGIVVVAALLILYPLIIVEKIKTKKIFSHRAYIIEKRYEHLQKVLLEETKKSVSTIPSIFLSLTNKIHKSLVEIKLTKLHSNYQNVYKDKETNVGLEDEESKYKSYDLYIRQILEIIDYNNFETWKLNFFLFHILKMQLYINSESNFFTHEFKETYQQAFREIPEFFNSIFEDNAELYMKNTEENRVSLLSFLEFCTLLLSSQYSKSKINYNLNLNKSYYQLNILISQEASVVIYFITSTVLFYTATSYGEPTSVNILVNDDDSICFTIKFKSGDINLDSSQISDEINQLIGKKSGTPFISKMQKRIEPREPNARRANSILEVYLIENPSWLISLIEMHKLNVTSNVIEDKISILIKYKQYTQPLYIATEKGYNSSPIVNSEEIDNNDNFAIFLVENTDIYSFYKSILLKIVGSLNTSLHIFNNTLELKNSMLSFNLATLIIFVDSRFSEMKSLTQLLYNKQFCNSLPQLHVIIVWLDTSEDLEIKNFKRNNPDLCQVSDQVFTPNQLPYLKKVKLLLEAQNFPSKNLSRRLSTKQYSANSTHEILNDTTQYMVNIQTIRKKSNVIGCEVKEIILTQPILLASIENIIDKYIFHRNIYLTKTFNKIEDSCKNWDEYIRNITKKQLHYIKVSQLNFCFGSKIIDQNSVVTKYSDNKIQPPISESSPYNSLKRRGMPSCIIFNIIRFHQVANIKNFINSVCKTNMNANISLNIPNQTTYWIPPLFIDWTTDLTPIVEMSYKQVRYHLQSIVESLVIPINKCESDKEIKEKVKLLMEIWDILAYNIQIDEDTKHYLSYYGPHLVLHSLVVFRGFMNYSIEVIQSISDNSDMIITFIICFMALPLCKPGISSNILCDTHSPLALHTNDIATIESYTSSIVSNLIKLPKFKNLLINQEIYNQIIINTILSLNPRISNDIQEWLLTSARIFQNQQEESSINYYSLNTVIRASSPIIVQLIASDPKKLLVPIVFNTVMHSHVAFTPEYSILWTKKWLKQKYWENQIEHAFTEYSTSLKNYLDINFKYSYTRLSNGNDLYTDISISWFTSLLIYNKLYYTSSDSDDEFLNKAINNISSNYTNWNQGIINRPWDI
ncbi:hypothetical protein cand_011000 [Cryptosporidium andersoni]|uniref:Uncharacterized protein n=1 Tax=Cryptosporidium andersoni TaxID=117008 RepID=A0A1J4MQ79_9CRYT|nr:hypothetical protein cand_011000 [Cryptosporidium andersoni]